MDKIYYLNESKQTVCDHILAKEGSAILNYPSSTGSTTCNSL